MGRLTQRYWTFDTPGMRIFMDPSGYLAFYTPFYPEQSIECLNPCDLRAWA